jgi:hypothetical protein
MTRGLALLAVAATAIGLGGCVAGMAASAVSMAAREARGAPASNAHLAPAAAAACSAQAAQHGTVKIIDVEQRSASKIVVWGGGRWRGAAQLRMRVRDQEHWLQAPPDPRPHVAEPVGSVSLNCNLGTRIAVRGPCSKLPSTPYGLVSAAGRRIGT